MYVEGTAHTFERLPSRGSGAGAGQFMQKAVEFHLQAVAYLTVCLTPTYVDYHESFIVWGACA